MKNDIVKRIEEFSEELDDLHYRIDELDTDLYAYLTRLPDDAQNNVRYQEAVEARDYILGALDSLKEARDSLTGAIA